MIVKKIKIENYKLLKDFSIDLEDVLSLVIGKNNTGKTSFLSILDKFLNRSEQNKFSFDDFNLDFRNSLTEIVDSETEEENFVPLGIKLKLFIEYDGEDSLENISEVMMDLNPENNTIVLGFEYSLNHTSLAKLKSDYSAFDQQENANDAANENYEKKDLNDFLKENHKTYFRLFKKALAFDVETKHEIDSKFIDLEEKKISIRDIINFQYISAKRSVDNNERDKSLSAQTSKIYKKTESSSNNDAVEEFKQQLHRTDVALTGIYKSIFESTIESVKKFGGMEENDSLISIESTLQHKELLEGNTTVFYNHEGTTLPEYNNGLGYMNLICMIFELEILLQEFKKKKDEKPADINLLFIEEPEAHTHPQMQYVFIKNIKSILNAGIIREDGQNRKLQTIISTHSSHIVAESSFEDIKYLKKEGSNEVIAKNLTELKAKYAESPKHYEFLKQYLTLNRAEIFFADKAILIEGATERILMPALMKKIDLEDNQDNTPLISQNVSIIEVGAYAQIFDEFIEFAGIKTLIITDLDSVDADGKKCKASVGVSTSNSALEFFYNPENLEALRNKGIDQKSLKKNDSGWVQDGNGNLCIVYQVEEDGNMARSFEESFIHANRDFINNQKDDFRGLKNRHLFDEQANDAYKLADDCIGKKTHFALDILFHSNDSFNNWQTPLYIKQGLQWLKQ